MAPLLIHTEKRGKNPKENLKLLNSCGGWGIKIRKNMIMIIKAIILITVEMTVRDGTN